jgi:hypothetical protein
MKNNENSLRKNHHYVNASRDITVKATRLKLLECIGKCISELLKKNCSSIEGLVPKLYRFQIKAFFRDGAYSIAPTVYPMSKSYNLLSLLSQSKTFPSGYGWVGVGGSFTLAP